MNPSSVSIFTAGHWTKRRETQIGMIPELQSHPRLAPGCRLGENNQQRVLLMPERALRLNGPSLEIIERCDGKHTVQQIITELQQIYSKAEPKKVETDILDYLARLHDQRALDFA
jgi:pyrroloquinoline quinone biosynthesis protein D